MLNQQQSALLNAIFSGSSELSFLEGNAYSQGLKIYQHSLIANAARALSITYATVHSYIGKAAFDGLVERYLKSEMKQAYDWGEFGSTFAQFISVQSLENSDLLSEIAKLDFACHQAERSKNVEVNLSTLNLLSEHDAYKLFFTLCAGTQLVCSTLPLDEVNNTISELTQANKIKTLDDVMQQLTQLSNQYEVDQKGLSSAENNHNNENSTLFYFVVFRPDFQATYTRITAVEYEWLTLLLKGKQTNRISIGQALDEMNNEGFSFVDWLPSAIKDRRINGISLNL